MAVDRMAHELFVDMVLREITRKARKQVDVRLAHRLRKSDRVSNFRIHRGHLIHLLFSLLNKESPSGSLCLGTNDALAAKSLHLFGVIADFLQDILGLHA